MNTVIKEYLNSRKYAVPVDVMFDCIDRWKEWYRGDTTESSQYRSMGMAKKTAEDWATLLLNEKTKIKAGEYEERLNEILGFNNFDVKGNQLVEVAFALGTGAFAEHKDTAGNVIIDYFGADMIYPISWNNADITECAFAAHRIHGGGEIIHLQLHRFGRVENGETAGKYYIENVFLNADSGETVSLSDEFAPLTETGSAAPLFQIIRPNICNNIDSDSPFGISVFANSLEQLRCCGIVHDSYINEFVLGRKRLVVPISAAKVCVEEDGAAPAAFDANDAVFYRMPGEEDLKLAETGMALRAQEHQEAIQCSLDLLNFKTGMETGREKNAEVIRTAVVNMVKAIAFLDTGSTAEAAVDFGYWYDEGADEVIDRNIKLVQAGLRSKKSAVMEIDRCSEADAEAQLARIAEDNQPVG